MLRRTLRLPDGRETVWDVLDLPRSVAVLALTPDDQVVLVRQFRPALGRQVVSLPGGIVDEGEEVLAAAGRELREETGYTADSVEVIASVQPNNSTHARYAALARGCTRTHPQELDEFEDCEVVLMSLPDVRRDCGPDGWGAWSRPTWRSTTPGCSEAHLAPRNPTRHTSPTHRPFPDVLGGCIG